MALQPNTTPFRLAKWGLRIVSLAAILGFWFYGNRVADVSPLLLPDPLDAWNEFVELISGEVWSDVGVTAFEVLMALLVSMAGATIIAIAVGPRPRMSRVSEQLIAWYYVTPTVVLFPLFLLWFGVGVWSKVLYASINAGVPITLNALQGMRYTDPALIRVGRAFGASRLRLEFSIRLRACFPLLISGIRVGAALCFINVLLAELLGSTRGVGFRIARSTQTLNPPTTYALIGVVLLLVAVMYTLITLSERFGRQNQLQRAAVTAKRKN